MQHKKQQLERELIAISRKEFLELGFEKTTLRSIAEKLNTTVSNLYHYTPNKAQLFTQIVTPLKNKLYYMFENNNYLPQLSFSHAGRMVANLLFDMSDDFMLLFFRAEKSPEENFKKSILDEFCKFLIRDTQRGKLRSTNEEMLLCKTIAHSLLCGIEFMFLNCKENRFNLETLFATFFDSLLSPLYKRV